MNELKIDKLYHDMLTDKIGEIVHDRKVHRKEPKILLLSREDIYALEAGCRYWSTALGRDMHGPDEDGCYGEFYGLKVFCKDDCIETTVDNFYPKPKWKEVQGE